MNDVARRVAVLLVPGLVAACARAGEAAVPLQVPASCSADATSSIRHLLYFGRNVPGGGVVGDSALAGFLAEEVAQRFPDGFTIWDATGHWRGASGRTETERTMVLMILHPDGDAADSAVRAIADAYKGRFRQEAVLRERDIVCSRLQ